MFRCANGRNNQIISASVELHLLYADYTSEGHSITRFIPLKLHKSYTPIFALSWSVFHTIDLGSPLIGLTKEEMLQKKYEFIIVINGTDDIYTQTIHQTKYYTPLDIEFDKYFIDILQRKPDGTRTIDYRNFNQLKEV
jgi:inward rectifier potassium channel